MSVIENQRLKTKAACLDNVVYWLEIESVGRRGGCELTAPGDDWQACASPFVAGRPVQLSETGCCVCISVSVYMSLFTSLLHPVDSHVCSQTPKSYKLD